MSELSDDQEIVLEMIKEWFIENDASVLAVECIVVYWGSPTGSVTNHDFVKLRLNEVVKMLRGTRIPLALMKYMTEDAIRAAAQETERMYERGVDVSGVAAQPQYYNYAEHRRMSAEEVVVEQAVKLCLRANRNMLAMSIYKVIDKVFEEMGIIDTLPSARKRNVMLDAAAKKWGLRHKRHKNRMTRREYDEDGKESLAKYTCIQIPRDTGMPTELTEEQQLKWCHLILQSKELGMA